MVSTRRGNGTTCLSMIGKSPGRDWELALQDSDQVKGWFTDEKIKEYGAMKHRKLFFELGFFLALAFGCNCTFAQNNFWKQTDGPYGGEILSLACSANGHLFAGSHAGWVFRSTDHGANWTEAATGLIDHSVRTLVITSNGNIFAGTFGGGVFRSIDNGDTWTPVNAGLTNTKVGALTINPVTQNIFAGTFGGGVYRSMDHGDHWSEANRGLTSIEVRALAINSATRDVFAGTLYGGIFCSTNDGTTWTPVNTGLSADRWGYFYIPSLAIKASNGYVFASTGNSIFRSTDNGDHWVWLTTDLALSLAVHSNGYIIVGTRGTYGGYLYPLTENGATSQVKFLPDAILSLAINSNGHIFAGTNGSGVFRSTDNARSAAPINTGLHKTVVHSLAISPNGYIFAGTAGRGIFQSVQPTTAVEEITEQMPLSFELAQNYPNPFNPATTIAFSIVRAGHVTLKVFNPLGEVIATLVDRKLNAGQHQVRWEATTVASGIYFYRLQSGEVSLTQKMILAR